LGEAGENVSMRHYLFVAARTLGVPNFAEYCLDERFGVRLS
jgi:hypothetical protein